MTMSAAPEQLDLFTDTLIAIKPYRRRSHQQGRSVIRRHVEYGWLASEADVAATHVVQLVTNARVKRADPQEPVAAYLRDAFAKVAEHTAGLHDHG
jgi:hypothetical protein